MEELQRFKVVPDKPNGGYRIFDVEKDRFLNNQMDESMGEEVVSAMGNFTIWKRRVQAEAWVDRISDWPALKDPASGEAATRANGGTETAVEEEEDEVVVERSEHQKKMDGWQTLVLKKLEGKVCCSKCGKGYYGHSGSLAVGPAAAAVHSLKVTRYLGADDPRSKLMVDLECVECGHGGMYQFENNPIFLDIPF